MTPGRLPAPRRHQAAAPTAPTPSSHTPAPANPTRPYHWRGGRERQTPDHICTYMRTYILPYLQAYICIYICINIYIYIYTYMYTCVLLHIYIYVHMLHIRTCTATYTNSHTSANICRLTLYVYTYIYTYIYIRRTSISGPARMANANKMASHLLGLWKVAPERLRLKGLEFKVFFFLNPHVF